MERLTRVLAGAVMAWGAVVNLSVAEHPPCRDFAYGNAGFGAGYSMAWSRGWSGGWSRGGYACTPRVPCRPPVWRPCYPCRPCGGWYSETQTVYLAAPVGGGAMFFSGGIVPWPVPYAMPVPYAGPSPWLGSRGTSRNGNPSGVHGSPSLAGRTGVGGAASVSARTRAARLIADGDRALAESHGDRARLATAAATYGRAAVIAKDDPDIHLRHAIVLSSLGRRRDADAATERAVALDGRLAERTADGISTAVARGMAILQEIAAAAAPENPSVAEAVASLAEVWAGPPAGPLASLGAGTPGTP